MVNHEINERIHRLMWSTNQDLFDWEKPLPLALGVRDEIHELFPELNKKHVQQFMRWWTKRIEYLEATLKSYHRYHLSGRQQCTITKAQREYAAKCIELKKSKTKRARSEV